MSALLAGAPALAQDGSNWWERLPGFGSPGPITTSRAPPAGERKAERLDDLRQDRTPFRSDLMLDALDRSIARYQRIVDAGGWPAVPGNRSIRPGDDDPRVAVIRQRLRISGDMPAASSGFEGYTFDGDLQAAIERFQKRHGLRLTNRIDRSTLAALKVSAQSRLNQMKLNRHRLRELLQGRIEDRYVIVNVPGYELEAVNRFEVEQRHRVIVGREGRDTPALKTAIRALNFFPYWRVPDSVASLDLVPRLKTEPDYLDKERIRVLTGGSYSGQEVAASSIDWSTFDPTKIKFRQDPGEWNALGLVRLDMPNEHGVYMHDTPMKPLFRQRARAFSAGCVRVQDVFSLAAWLVQGEPDWDQARIDEVLARGEAVDVELNRPVPVYFTYLTAWSERDGTVQFRQDIYGRDGAAELAGEQDPDEPSPPLTSIQALSP